MSRIVNNVFNNTDDFIKFYNEINTIIANYSINDKVRINRAYAIAYKAHEKQKRKSGEPYIIHPVRVASILANMHADADTVIAALLHDTVEDSIKNEMSVVDLPYIRSSFSPVIENLVKGVTKKPVDEFNNNREARDAEYLKNLLINEDIRVIIIKLADTLDNMRSLNYQSKEKQLEIAKRTLTKFVPIAGYLGEYECKRELEDLCLSYLEPDVYKSINTQLNDSSKHYQKVLNRLSTLLIMYGSEKNIDIQINLSHKSIYEIYLAILSGRTIDEIHDLFTINIITDTKDNCYSILKMITNEFTIIESEFKDYIKMPKANKYEAIHASMLLDENVLIQFKIRTNEMDLINRYGITAFWRMKKGNDLDKIVSEYQFHKKIIELSELYPDAMEFNEAIKHDILVKNVYVKVIVDIGEEYTSLELPIDSTIADLAYYISSELGHNLMYSFANDIPVKFNYKIKNQDKIHLFTTEYCLGPTIDQTPNCNTYFAKKKSQKK